MLELRTDLWATPCDARCITTNGYVKRDGRCVMGRGTAAQALTKYPGIALELGRRISAGGNRVYNLGEYDHAWLFAYPVKHNWWERADIRLIRHSAVQLVDMAGTMRLRKILLPRPGCSNGKLEWDDVRPEIALILDDRFVVVSL